MDKIEACRQVAALVAHIERSDATNAHIAASTGFPTEGEAEKVAGELAAYLRVPVPEQTRRRYSVTYDFGAIIISGLADDR